MDSTGHPVHMKADGVEHFIDPHPQEHFPFSHSLPTCSPALANWLENPTSIKSNAGNQENEQSFCWSIDQMANLLPADIDETSRPHIDPDAHIAAWSPHRRVLWQRRQHQLQSDIETYFHPSNRIAPSPWDAPHRADAVQRMDCMATWSPQPNTLSPSRLPAPALDPDSMDMSADPPSPIAEESGTMDGSLDCSATLTTTGSLNISLRRRLFERALEGPAAAHLGPHPVCGPPSTELSSQAPPAFAAPRHWLGGPPPLLLSLSPIAPRGRPPLAPLDLSPIRPS